ncbi:MAG TPA: hypothetical protein VE620_15275 [Myxococcales bacterium]|jgi:hypothetical protein|nr:hypothetical protein [Myxococcales bacterium]
MSFFVPPGTGTISILSQGLDSPPAGTVPPDFVTFKNVTQPNSVVPTMLKDPSGNVVYNDDPPGPIPADPSVLQAFYGGFSPWTGMLTVPNATLLLEHTALQGSLPAGNWQFVVNDFALECTTQQHTSTNDCGLPDGGFTGSSTSAYDVQVLLKPGVAPPTGTIDVAFYPLSGTAAALSVDPNFKRMTDGLARLYAAAGICLGTITVYDLPDWAKQSGTFGGLINADNDTSCGQLSQLFTLSAPGNQINFFLVNGFTSSSGPLNVVGIDGTIPGPSSVGGTTNSGAAVLGTDLTASANTNCQPGVFDPLNCGADQVAYIAAHEGGHFLGLYHTTERTGDAFDPLTDTKRCFCTSCAPVSQQANCFSVHASSSPTLMSTLECVHGTTTPECGGGDNLMFWLLGAASVGKLSPQQGQVMRANPIVR